MENSENPHSSPRREGTTVLDPRLFSLVSASYLAEHRQRLVAARGHVYQILGKTANAWEARPVGFDEVTALDQSSPGPVEFAIPVGWGEAELDRVESSPEPADSFYVRWNSLMAQEPGARVQELSRGRKLLEAEAQVPSDPAIQANLIGEVAELTFLVNRASLSINRTAGADDDSLAQETLAVVQAVLSLIAESADAVALFQTLEKRPSGQVLNHVVRVFTTMVAFLLHYNGWHRQGLNQKLRALFPGRYRERYAALIPSLRDSLNTFDNLVRLPALAPDTIKVYALGTLMHDIGKTLDLDYFETGGAYDRARIRQHPIIGSGLFQRTYGQKYEAARYIVGDHHNYLFHKDGYGLTRWDRSREGWPTAPVVCSIADQLSTFRDGQSLGFFPVELCAVVDVYDALTDSSRIYKKPMSSTEALGFMNDHFCRAHKFDPILFGLFIEFLAAMGTEVPGQFRLFGHSME